MSRTRQRENNVFWRRKRRFLAWKTLFSRW